MKIKFFVCHSANSHNSFIFNRLYCNIIGGANDDKNKRLFYAKDNQGENISDYNKCLNEFTVQYYVWKNMNYEYYGLAHYRRFLSFSKNFDNLDTLNNINVKHLSLITIHRYKLISRKELVNILKKFDVICAYSHSCKRRGFKNVIESYLSLGKYSKDDIELIGKLIEYKKPEFYKYFLEYLNSHNPFVCNIYVLKKPYFNELNNIQNSVIFDFINDREKQDKNFKNKRVAGYMLEIIYGAYIYSLIKRKIPIFFTPKVVILNAKSFPRIFLNKILSTGKKIYLKNSYKKHNKE